MTNFLDARCPNCGDDTQLDIAATVWLRITEDGTDADASSDGSHDYEAGDTCVCGVCSYAAPLSEFEKAGQTTNTKGGHNE